MRNLLAWCSLALTRSTAPYSRVPNTLLCCTLSGSAYEQSAAGRPTNCSPHYGWIFAYTKINIHEYRYDTVIGSPVWTCTNVPTAYRLYEHTVSFTLLDLARDGRRVTRADCLGVRFCLQDYIESDCAVFSDSAWYVDILFFFKFWTESRDSCLNGLILLTR